MCAVLRALKGPRDRICPSAVGCLHPTNHCTPVRSFFSRLQIYQARLRGPSKQLGGDDPVDVRRADGEGVRCRRGTVEYFCYGVAGFSSRVSAAGAAEYFLVFLLVPTPPKGGNLLFRGNNVLQTHHRLLPARLRSIVTKLQITRAQGAVVQPRWFLSYVTLAFQPPRAFSSLCVFPCGVSSWCASFFP